MGSFVHASMLLIDFFDSFQIIDNKPAKETPFGKLINDLMVCYAFLLMYFSSVKLSHNSEKQCNGRLGCDTLPDKRSVKSAS